MTNEQPVKFEWRTAKSLNFVQPYPNFSDGAIILSCHKYDGCISGFELMQNFFQDGQLEMFLTENNKRLDMAIVGADGHRFTTIKGLSFVKSEFESFKSKLPANRLVQFCVANYVGWKAKKLDCDYVRFQLTVLPMEPIKRRVA